MKKPGFFRLGIGWVCMLGIVCALGLLSGCQSGAKKVELPLRPPFAQTTQRHYFGSALSGPQVGVAEISSLSKAWEISATAYAVSTLPHDGFESIGPQARLVLSDGSGSLMNPSARLVYSTRFRSVEMDANVAKVVGDSKTAVEISQSRGAVALGTTFSIELSQPVADGNVSQRRQVMLEIYRTAGTEGYQLALSSDDRVALPAPTPPTGSDPSTPLPIAPPPKNVRETVVIHRKPAGVADRILLALPMQFTGSTAVGVVIDLKVNLDSSSNSTSVASDLKKLLDESTEKEKARQATVATSGGDLIVSAGLEMLAGGGDAPRASIVYLAEQSGAKLTHAVALVADEKLLTLITRTMREKLAKLPSRDRASVAWMMDRATIQTLASIKDDETGKSLPPVQGVLQNFAGEAGRQLDLLQSLANEARNSEDLNNRLIAEHLIFLEDNSPASRVRAYDWLSARGKAPAGFVPLAPAKSRRDALEKSQEPATAPTTRP